MAPTPPQRSRAGIWILITLLLAASLVGTIWVPFYQRLTPAAGGFPFFYWYQMIWIPLVALLSWLAYLLTKAGRPRAGSGPAAASGSTPAPDTRQGEAN